MDDPIIASVRAVLELGWPAIVLIQSVILWKAYTDRTNQFIDWLKAQAEAQKQGPESSPSQTRQGLTDADTT